MTGQGEQARADDVERAWARVRDDLRAAAGRQLFDRWLKPMQLIADADPEVIRLALPSAFMTNWVKSHYADRLTYAFRTLMPGVRTVSIETAVAGTPVRAVTAESLAAPESKPVRAAATPRFGIAPPPEETPRFGLAAAPAPAPRPAPASPAMPAPAVQSPVARSAPAARAADLPAGLPGERPDFDPRYDFARFVVDSSNRVAFNAARALAEPGVPRFSPLYLHSGTGLGKTHLMHAIGRAFLEANPNASAIYLPAERFMFEFVSAVRARDTHAFKARLRAVDLLMIDDLQFIAGKDSTQEEFFHTVNAFMDAGKRLVIACDRSPQLLDGVEPRLVSRLCSGLVADIGAPELDLRRAILARRIAELPGLPVPQDVQDLLVTRIAGSVRELEGAFNRVIAYAQLIGEDVTMAFAMTTLGEQLRGPQKRITIDEIQRAVSSHFDLRQLDLVSARRAVSIARPRQIAMYLAKRLTTRSLPEIGRKFGNRDHSTVIHAVKRIEELRGKDGEIDGAVRMLIRQLEG